jgi:Ca2+-binding EF-hand superfamily protein
VLFALVFPNNSHGMDQAFKGHCEVEKHTFANQARDMVRQASRVLENMSSVDSPYRSKSSSRPSRPTHEVASIMTKYLKEDRGGMLFKNLDPYQHGHITQDDFIHILSSKNTGLSRNEMKEIAHELDSDRSGLLNYSKMYSALDSLKTPKQDTEVSSYSKAFEESKRGDSGSGSGSSSSYSRNYEDSRVQSAPASAPESTPAPTPAAVPAAQPRPYDGLQQYMNCQTKVENEKREMEEKKSMNESRYGDAFDRATLIEKPSNNFAPLVSVKAKDNVARYSRGSGSTPYYNTPANINDIVFNRFVDGRTGEKNAAVFDIDDVVGTVDYEKVGDIINDGNHNVDASSYTKAYESLRSNISHTPGEAKSPQPSHPRHHKSFAPLPTSKVTGGVDPEERLFLGNPNTGRNRNSRGFHNSFIFDHRVPARLRRPERSHSAPPGKRHYDTVDNKKSNNPEVRDPKLDSVGSLFRYLSDLSDTHNVVPSPVRVSQKKHGSANNGSGKTGEPERKQFADFACAPPSPPKKKVVSDTNSVKRSMNTLVTQLNNHSKIKILNHKMKRIDVSNSGYVNKSEFSTALKEMGVKISPAQVSSLYDTHAKDNVGLDITQSSSLKLSSSHQRGINVQDFIQKMRTRTSSNMLASRRHAADTSHTVVPSSHDKTPLEREDARVWKKVVEALSEENSGGKRIIADFFRDAQVNHQNEVHADQLFNELNHIGSKVNDVEFRNMLSTVRRKPNGKVDVDDFAREYHQRSVECRDFEKWMTLMPSLASSADPNIEARGEQFKRIMKTQKKHFTKKQGLESASDPNYRTANFKERLNNPVVGATKSFEKSHVPACLTMSDAKEFRAERLKWSKLSSTFLNHKDTLLSAFGGEEGIHQPLSENLMKDKLYEAGVLLGNDDIKILQSYATTSTSHEESKDLTFGKMCSSMGLNLEKDNRKRMTLSSSADFEHDSGIFGSSSSSLMSNPNYQSTVLTAPPTFEDKFVRGNRKRRVDEATGRPMAGAPQPMSSGSASEFWQMKHVPEIKKLPAKQLSYHQRLQLPESSLAASINGSSGRGFTSLRQIKEERKRSSSAPPRYSPMSRDVNEQTNARSHMWQRESSSGTVGGRGRTTGVRGGAEPSRFAAAPLAEYIAMRQQQQRSETTHVSTDSNNVPMTTLDLQSSFTSSASEIDAR